QAGSSWPRSPRCGQRARPRAPRPRGGRPPQAWRPGPAPPGRRGRVPRRPFGPVSSSPLTAELRLQRPCVLEVRDKRWPHLDEQSSQLSIRRAGNQRAVQGLEDLLVIGRLVRDVRVVEGTAFERLQACQVPPPAVLEAAAGLVG